MDMQLRAWRMQDLEDLVKNANNAKIADNLTNKFPYPYTAVSGKKFIEFATNTKDLATIFCIEVDGEAAGGIGIHPLEDVFCKNAELGYWLGESYWGKGIMTKAINEVVAYAFQHYNINRLFARPYGSNIASQKLLEKCGFTLEGKFSQTLFKNNRYEDELVYALRKV